MIRTLSIAIVLCLSLSPTRPAHAQSPTPIPTPALITPIAAIDAPAAHPGGVPLVLFGDRSVSSVKLSWILVAPKAPFEVADLPGHPGAILIVRKPDPGITYRIALVAYGDGNPAFAFDFADVPVGVLPNPPPTPGPTPQPVPPAPQPIPPAPTPIPVEVGPLHAVLVFAVDDPSTARIRVSPIKEQLRTLDCNWSTVATVQPEYAGYQKFLPASGVPAVLFLGFREGRTAVIKTIEGPTRPEDVVGVVKAMRGMK